LKVAEKTLIAAGTAANMAKVIEGIQKARFRNAVRAAATGKAATDFGTAAAPVAGSDDIINDYFGQFLDANDVVAAYNNG